MNLMNLLRAKVFKALILTVGMAILITACTKEEHWPDDESAPVILYAETDALHTRATTENQWEGGEEVLINLNDGASMNGFFTFTVSQNGSLTSSLAYWNNRSQEVTAYGWRPAVYKFPTDQSSKEKYQNADFIFATKVEKINSNNFINADKKLLFKHKTSKINVVLTEGEGVSSVAGAEISLFGYDNFASIDNKGSNPTGEIENPSGNGFIKSWYDSSKQIHTALLLPRKYSSETFIKITLNGFDYYYKTPSLDLKEGYSYSFDITVNKTKIVVTQKDDMGWGEGSSSDIPGKIKED